MPSRLLREGILDSEAVNTLSFAAEVFYRRLMSVVDDFGRFDGRAAILKGRLYALKPSVTDADIAGWIGECDKAGLIALYAVDQKPYLLFKKLGPARAKESKFPAPPLGTDTKPPVNTHPFTDVNKREQAFTSVPYSYSGSGTSSNSGTRTETGSGDPAPTTPSPKTESESSVSPSESVPFDPLRAEQEARKLFEQRWNAAGLRKFTRLGHMLHGQLAALLLDPWWAENYPAALAKAGTIPFLATGAGRLNGPMGVEFFLRNDDVARKILDGAYDPQPAAGSPTAPAKDRKLAEMDAVMAEHKAKEAAKRKAG